MFRGIARAVCRLLRNNPIGQIGRPITGAYVLGLSRFAVLPTYGAAGGAVTSGIGEIGLSSFGEFAYVCGISSNRPKMVWFDPQSVLSDGVSAMV